jgi:hypothetical protein
MPYIKANDGRRKALRNFGTAQSAGELNYQMFYYIKHFYPNDNDGNYLYDMFQMDDVIRNYINNFLGEKPNYQKYNDLTGALVRCYKEVERRLKIEPRFLIKIMESYDEEIAKYEDLKILENTDVE